MVLLFLKIGLAAFMLTGGVIKVLHVPFQVEHWRHYQYPLWFLSMTGGLEIVGALGMAWGVWNPYSALSSGVLFSILMIGAIHAHIFRARQSFLMAIPAAVCFICSLAIVIMELI
ncbi:MULTISPECIES: DoxX family protein [Bacillus]|uniref:DoxX family protein n=1 Tax=Bacillus TaxID=1386 RepID=UPI00041B0D37|nr:MULTISPECIES: DoxX family protein [Bacillus]QHZ47520.1 DoxX family protein [Bacillus sp. NSP9.1]WFA03579.1 DoxX family protein [Bacillus sp. HSf4]